MYIDALQKSIKHSHYFRSTVMANEKAEEKSKMFPVVKLQKEVGIFNHLIDSIILSLLLS